MRNRNGKFVLVFLVLVAMLAGCAHSDAARPVDRDDMYKLATSTMYLTGNVEELYRTSAVPGDADNETILSMATEKDENLRQDFIDYKVLFKPELGHAVVLVCTKDGRQALIEESGCSLGPDKLHWEAAAPVPCAFTIDERYMEKNCKTGR